MKPTSGLLLRRSFEERFIHFATDLHPDAKGVKKAKKESFTAT